MSASNDQIDLTMLGERIAWVRKTYGDSIDLSDLTRLEFATMLGFCATVYETYELGERMPTIEFLVELHRKTGISLDWLLNPDEPEISKPSGRSN